MFNSNEELPDALQKAGRIVDEKFRGSETLKILVPGKETVFYLDSVENLSPKQRRLLEIQGYFYENTVSILFDELKGEKPPIFSEEDKQKILIDIDELELFYEDNLDRNNEYPAAREVLSSLKSSLELMKKSDQPTSIVWKNVAERLEPLHMELINKGQTDAPQQQIFSQVIPLLRENIYSRIPMLVPKLTSENYTLPKSVRTIIDNTEEHFDLEESLDKYEEYLEKHHSYEEIKLEITREDALKWRNQLIKLTNEKGSSEGVITGHGTKITLEGDEIKRLFGGESVEIWYPGKSQLTGNELPIHITVFGLDSGNKPRYIKITEDGEMLTGVNVYDDVPETFEAAEQTRSISQIEWRNFIEKTIEQAINYTPSR